MTDTTSASSAILGNKLKRPRFPDGDVVRAFGRLVMKIIEPLGHPGAVLIPPLVSGGTYEDEVASAVDEFDRAVQDQEARSGF